MLSSPDVAGSLVQKLSPQIKLPFLSEDGKVLMIRWVIAQVAKLVPPWVLKALESASDGIDEEERAYFEDLITKQVNDLVNIPVIGESVEETLIRPVVKQLLDQALHGFSLHNLLA